MRGCENGVRELSTFMANWIGYLMKDVMMTLISYWVFIKGGIFLGLDDVMLDAER